MRATFFLGQFSDEPMADTTEHELTWLAEKEMEQACFHACHVRAVHQA